jgi:hypothetical protein
LPIDSDSHGVFGVIERAIFIITIPIRGVEAKFEQVILRRTFRITEPLDLHPGVDIAELLPEMFRIDPVLNTKRRILAANISINDDVVIILIDYDVPKRSVNPPSTEDKNEVCHGAVDILKHPLGAGDDLGSEPVEDAVKFRMLEPYVWEDYIT